jgi:hypothetical protein
VRSARRPQTQAPTVETRPGSAEAVGVHLLERIVLKAALVVKSIPHIGGCRLCRLVGLAMLRTDFVNAFNNAHCAAMLKAAIDMAPYLARNLAASFAPSILFFSTARLISAEGAQQGGPEGPAAFGLHLDLAKWEFVGDTEMGGQS